MNFTEVALALDAVLTEQKSSIGEFSQYSGGWEGWLQIEMTKKWTPGKVYREVSVWNDRRSIDLWFPETKFGVELKCLGLNRVSQDDRIISNRKSKYREFTDLVLEDVQKVRTIPQGGGGMAIVVIPTWLPGEPIATIKQALESQTFQWAYMGKSGFVVGIHRSNWL